MSDDQPKSWHDCRTPDERAFDDAMSGPIKAQLQQNERAHTVDTVLARIRGYGEGLAAAGITNDLRGHVTRLYELLDLGARSITRPWAPAPGSWEDMARADAVNEPTINAAITDVVEALGLANYPGWTRVLEQVREEHLLVAPSATTSVHQHVAEVLAPDGARIGDAEVTKAESSAGWEIRLTEGYADVLLDMAHSDHLASMARITGTTGENGKGWTERTLPAAAEMLTAWSGSSRTSPQIDGDAPAPASEGEDTGEQTAEYGRAIVARLTATINELRRVVVAALDYDDAPGDRTPTPELLGRLVRQYGTPRPVVISQKIVLDVWDEHYDDASGDGPSPNAAEHFLGWMHEQGYRIVREQDTAPEDKLFALGQAVLYPGGTGHIADTDLNHDAVLLGGSARWNVATDPKSEPRLGVRAYPAHLLFAVDEKTWLT